MLWVIKHFEVLVYNYNIKYAWTFRWRLMYLLINHFCVPAQLAGDFTEAGLRSSDRLGSGQVL